MSVYPVSYGFSKKPLKEFYPGYGMLIYIFFFSFVCIDGLIVISYRLFMIIFEEQRIGDVSFIHTQQLNPQILYKPQNIEILIFL